MRQGEGLVFGDLFCGAGGLSEGFRLAGFDGLFHVDADAEAMATYAANHPESVAVTRSVAGLTRADIGVGRRLDVLLGGPPCQGFSMFAPERSPDDPRNHLFRDYVRFVEEFRPRAFVMENVTGMLAIGKSRDSFHAVVETFRKAGYSVQAKILNAAHYGVPQERWRLFIVGVEDGLSFDFPPPERYSTRRVNFPGRDYTFADAVAFGREPRPGLLPPVTVGEAIGDLPAIKSGGGADYGPYHEDPSSEYQAWVREGSGGIHNHVCQGMRAVNLERIAHVGPGGSWRDVPIELIPHGLAVRAKNEHTRRYGRLRHDDVSGTIMTKCDPHWGTVVHYAQDRIISVREAARIQSFPDRFRFVGSRSACYRQVGNAVPPLLAARIAACVARSIKGGG